VKEIKEVLNARTGDYDDFLYAERQSLEAMLLHSSIGVDTLSDFVFDQIGSRSWDRVKLQNRDSPMISLLRGLTIEGNVESKLGKVHLYATNKFMDRKRYDFVVVQCEHHVQPAQLLVIFQYDRPARSPRFYAVVRYLRTSAQKEQPPASHQSPFQMYEWEQKPSALTSSNKRRRSKVKEFMYGIIDCKQIVTPAFVQSVFCKKKPLPICANPKWTDRFWYMERRYSDRGGWDDITIGDQTRIRTPAEENEGLNIVLPEMPAMDLPVYNSDDDVQFNDYDVDDDDDFDDFDDLDAF
jgi:hypothetical protein